MRVVRAITLASALLATLAIAAPARADIVPPRPFYADSGDTCVYGYARGDLLWVTPGPLPPIAVNLTGSVVDRPSPTDPRACRDDGFFSTATFTAYSGTVVVGSQAVRSNNGQVPFQFSLGTNRPETPVTHLVVQVCRDPLVTLPPSYCGRAVTYRPTSITPTA
jgi:hypothetical protein